MAIIINENVFTLHTKNSTYQMKVDAQGMLIHTYYGSRIDETDMSYCIYSQDRGFSEILMQWEILTGHILQICFHRNTVALGRVIFVLQDYV